jgi:hypothetical protein
MHLQPIFAGCERVGGAVAADLFKRGLCLPSGSNLSQEDLARVADTVRLQHFRTLLREKKPKEVRLPVNLPSDPRWRGDEIGRAGD